MTAPSRPSLAAQPLVRINLAIPLERSARARRSPGGFSLAAFADVLRDPVVVSFVVLAICSFLFVVYLDTAAVSATQHRAAAVRTAVADSARLAADLEQANKLVAKRGQLEAQIRQIEQVDRNRFAVPHLLDQLAEGLGANMWLTSVGTDTPDALGNVGFVVTGFAATREAVARYRDRLETSPFVAGMSPDSLREQSLNGIPLVFFQLQGQSEVADPSFLETETIHADGSRAASASAALVAPAVPGVTRSSVTPLGRMDPSLPPAPVPAGAASTDGPLIPLTDLAPRRP